MNFFVDTAISTEFSICMKCRYFSSFIYIFPYIYIDFHIFWGAPKTIFVFITLEINIILKMFIHLKYFKIVCIVRFATTMRTCPEGYVHNMYDKIWKNERCASLTGSVARVNWGSAMSTFFFFTTQFRRERANLIRIAVANGVNGRRVVYNNVYVRLQPVQVSAFEGSNSIFSNFLDIYLFRDFKFSVTRSIKTGIIVLPNP